MKPPLSHSYWVEPGQLVAGEHPGGADEAQTRERLAQLLAAGVRGFIDLTEAGERPPYVALLPPEIAYAHHPLPDHSIPRSPRHMQDVLRSLRQLMAEGAVYVHCRAGIGRTGTAVGCYLREQGLAPAEALEKLNQLWQQNARAVHWPTVPETEEQEGYVLAWQPAPAHGRSHARQRYRGCLVGLAVGDAMAAADPLSAAPACWTDDAGTALCVAESLLARQGFDGRDQLERYRAWAADPVAAGAAVSAQLRPVVREVLARALWSRSAVLGSHDPAQLDPSPLARSAVAAMFAAGRPGTAASLAADVTRVTHQAPLLVDACRVLAGMVGSALAGGSRQQVLDAAREPGGMPLRGEIVELAGAWGTAPTGRRRPPADVLGALDWAVRSFIKGSSFEDGLERARQTRSPDRDAVCAAYGALAGAFYGEAGIAESTRARLPNLSRVRQLADRLHDHGGAPHGPAA